MQSTLRLRLVQMTSTNAHEGNIATIQRRAAEAAAEGCELLAMPEASGLMNRDREAARRIIQEDAADPFLAACREAAAKHSFWIHTGSTPVRADDGRFLNRSHLIDDAGRIAAVYDKIHLFDVYLADVTLLDRDLKKLEGGALELPQTPCLGKIHHLPAAGDQLADLVIAEAGLDDLGLEPAFAGDVRRLHPLRPPHRDAQLPRPAKPTPEERTVLGRTILHQALLSEYSPRCKENKTRKNEATGLESPLETYGARYFGFGV